ncbi:MAG: hypothetical protein WC644_07345 [Ignavibacteria bacterium]
MRIILSFFLLAGVIVVLFIGHNHSEANVTPKANNNVTLDSTRNLPCCNIFNPFIQICSNPTDLVSYLCFENGIEVEKIITCACCREIWRDNNFNPPTGLNCLPPGTECRSEIKK